MSDQQISRRVVLRAGAAGAAGLGLAGVASACGSDAKPSASTSPEPTSPPTTTTPSGSSPATKPDATKGPAVEPTPNGEKVASLADIAVGAAVARNFSGSPIVVARPSKDNIVAFSALCTHQGCTVSFADKQYQCPCHFSAFNFATGQPESNVSTGQAGPAQTKLTQLQATTFDGDIYISTEG